MLSITACHPSHFVDHGAGGDRHRAPGFMDYTDDSCAIETSTSLREPPPSIAYNEHAGLGADLVDDPVDARHFDSRKNEISIESLAARPGGSRLGNEIVTDNKDPDVAARTEDAVSQCLPEIDDQVLVIFEHGDSRRPCLNASLWNSRDKPSEVSR